MKEFTFTPLHLKNHVPCEGSYWNVFFLSVCNTEKSVVSTLYLEGSLKQNLPPKKTFSTLMLNWVTKSNIVIKRSIITNFFRTYSRRMHRDNKKFILKFSTCLTAIIHTLNIVKHCSKTLFYYKLNSAVKNVLNITL